VKTYRQKIYQYYSSKRLEKLAPDTVEGFAPRRPYFDKVIRDHFPADRQSRILELGCGHGAFLYSIHKAGYVNAVGINGSEEQVREAGRLGIPGVTKGDLIEHLSACKEESLDLIIAFDVIEHFSKDEISILVDHVYRILKKGGKCICHQPNSEGPFGNFMRDWDFTHEMGFTRQSIAQLFLSSGFSSIQSYEDKPVVHGIKSLGRFVLWEFFIRQIYRFVRIVETGNCDAGTIFTQNFLTVANK
jgi:2-polyprenyl-3-methyl-5-hydroxy-6-metoxy-1,4-benzoquinol methylase